jgi:hypothetical protein
MKDCFNFCHVEHRLFETNLVLSTKLPMIYVYWLFCCRLFVLPVGRWRSSVEPLVIFQGFPMTTGLKITFFQSVAIFKIFHTMQ